MSADVVEIVVVTWFAYLTGMLGWFKLFVTVENHTYRWHWRKVAILGGWPIVIPALVVWFFLFEND